MSKSPSSAVFNLLQKELTPYVHGILWPTKKSLAEMTGPVFMGLDYFFDGLLAQQLNLAQEKQSSHHLFITKHFHQNIFLYHHQTKNFPLEKDELHNFRPILNQALLQQNSKVLILAEESDLSNKLKKTLSLDRLIFLKI